MRTDTATRLVPATCLTVTVTRTGSRTGALAIGAPVRQRIGMTRSLAHIALVVRDYDEAIDWFTGTLGFALVADEYQPEQDKRWVLVAPPGAGEGATTILLARASSPEQEAFIGNQAGGRVFLFLETDDFDRDFEAMRSRGVSFVREPKRAPYGKVAVFEDLYGNLWDLVQFGETG